MGFSVVFATAILGLVFILALSTVMGNLAMLAEEVGNQNLKLFSEMKLREETSIKIVSIEPVVVEGGSTLIHVEVLNEGKVSIMAAKFGSMDVLLKYHSREGALKLLWLPYNPTGGEDSWTVEGVKTDSINGEILNPVRGQSGQWDPGETIKLKIQLSQENEVDASPGNRLFILVCTPNGAKALSTYTF